MSTHESVQFCWAQGLILFFSSPFVVMSKPIDHKEWIPTSKPAPVVGGMNCERKLPGSIPR